MPSFLTPCSLRGVIPLLCILYFTFLYSPLLVQAASPMLDAKYEKEALDMLKSTKGAPKLEYGDVGSIIKRGWYTVARELIKGSHTHGNDHSAEVRRAVGEVKKEVDELIRLLNKQHEDIQVMSPAFQWAQSSDSVFLNIKFAYRFNAPGALTVEDENVTATDTSFYFSGIGTHSQIQKKYELSLDLFEAIEPKNIDWSFGSVGKLTVTLKKAKKAKWKRLTRSAAKISNMHVWWEMKEKYESELSKFKGEEKTAAAAAAAETASAGNSTTETSGASSNTTNNGTAINLDFESKGESISIGGNGQITRGSDRKKKEVDDDDEEDEEEDDEEEDDDDRKKKKKKLDREELLKKAADLEKMIEETSAALGKKDDSTQEEKDEL